MAASTAQIHAFGGKPSFASSSSLSRRGGVVFFTQRLSTANSSSFRFPKLRTSSSGSRRGGGVGPVRVVAEKVVGIDLGTTNSAVAVMEGGKPVIATNSEGQRTTPSVVAWTKIGDLLVGQIAKRQAVVNSENTFFSVKRFIGRKMAEVDEEAKQVSYTVVRDENGNVKLECPAMGKQFAAEEISAQVLRKLVDDASKFLNDKVTKAVVTVPAYFNDSQRTATKDAGRIAGLEVLRIINEPTAASLAYGFEKKNNETILVFDLGGGTFDVSVLEVGDGVFEVLSTSGDTHLGGDDFDKRIVDWLAASFKKDEGIDLLKDKQALQRLTETAEKAKMELSSLTQTSISLPFITATADGPKHIETTITRAKFEELCSDLLDRLKRPVETSLRDAKLSFSDLDEVILVGGSTRIPAVQELVRRVTGKEPNVTVNPDEVVALGAAVQVERMVKEAERFAKEDKEKREAIDTKNQADSVVYQTEKQLKELGEKVPGPVKEKVEAKLKDLKDAISGSSTQAMKDTMAALNQEVMQLGQSLYNRPGDGVAADGAGPAPGGSTGPSESSGKGPDGDVIDADFTDSK
ncbi:hypothetical protein RHGRI_014080 [Rhododendron griersonianum]|uniref:Uncharacterized protein n=1 Tax=Rhododendron griersonianum TaxID=479676 RepID=A0AAV6K820_9ERIC|nr:hypothetical protein RHGRI_014080 [Rhododendron griersonianum]KAG5548608.1 hypothetical protein RHGRI_014080 [Rhododendron griersonianum]